MAFEYPSRVYRLVFENSSDLAGLEVKARSISFGELQEWDESLGKTSEEMNGTPIWGDQLVERFSRALISWNLTRDGKPVPATAENFKAQDLNFVTQVASAWREAVVAVSEKKEPPLTNGAQSVAASIPMATL